MSRDDPRGSRRGATNAVTVPRTQPGARSPWITLCRKVGGDVLVTGRTGRSVIRDVQGSVSIQRHGGDVRVERVAGDLTVQRLENGEVQHQEVRGTVRLPRR
jgi:hypothetical protein